MAVAPAGQQGLLSRRARTARSGPLKRSCMPGKPCVGTASGTLGDRAGMLGAPVITSAAVCRDVLPLDGAVLQPARMLISSRAGSVQHISCVHTRAKRAAGGLTTEACRSRCIAARVRCGKSPSIFDTLLGLRIPQLVDQVCYDAGLP